MTNPAITRVAEFTKRLGEDGRSDDPSHVLVHAIMPYFDIGGHSLPIALAALHADLTHVLAELEGLNPNMAGWTAEEVTDIRAHHAAQLRRDEEPK